MPTPLAMLNLLHSSGFTVIRVLLLIALLIATATDLHRRRIPNLVTLPLALAAIIVHGVYGGFFGALASLLSFFAWFGLGFLFYKTVAGKEIGAGDIKMVMGTAACIGFMPAGYVTFISLVLLILWLFLRWLWQGTARVNFARLFAWLYVTATPDSEKLHFRPVGMDDRTPHAPFMLLSAIICYFLYQKGFILS